MSTLRDDWPECCDCGKPLTPEEAHYYEVQCEECVRKEMASMPHIGCGFCHPSKARGR